jgi:molybdopterin synthase sulfur carrier subunit
MPDEGKIKITVKLFATFRRGRFLEAVRDYPAGTQISGVIADLEIEPSLIGIIFIGGKHEKPEYVLKDGDTLALFPLLGGG